MVSKTKQPTTQPMKETAKALEAFDAYCALGPERSLTLLSQEMHKSLTQIKEWSSAHKWQERSRALDLEQNKVRLKKYESALDKMQERHISIALSDQRQALQRIEQLMSAGELPASAAVQLLKLSLDLERVARGAATEQLAIVGQDGGPVEMVIKTVWGRNADERKLREDSEMDDDPPGDNDEDR